MWRPSLKTESIILSLYVGNKLSEQEIVEDFDVKMFKFVKTLSCHEILKLLGREVFQAWNI
jgi:hypothetical protein